MRGQLDFGLRPARLRYLEFQLEAVEKGAGGVLRILFLGVRLHIGGQRPDVLRDLKLDHPAVERSNLRNTGCR